MTEKENPRSSEASPGADPGTFTDHTDSPNFTPASLAKLAERNYVRVNSSRSGEASPAELRDREHRVLRVLSACLSRYDDYPRKLEEVAFKIVEMQRRRESPKMTNVRPVADPGEAEARPVEGATPSRSTTSEDTGPCTNGAFPHPETECTRVAAARKAGAEREARLAGFGFEPVPDERKDPFVRPMSRHPYERGQVVEILSGKRAGQRHPVLDVYLAYQDDERPGVSIRDDDTELFYGLDEVSAATGKEGCAK